MLDVYDMLPKLTKYWQELSRPQSATMQPKYNPVPLYVLHNNKLHPVQELYLDGGRVVARIWLKH